jgi:hypothetical protein
LAHNRSLEWLREVMLHRERVPTPLSLFKPDTVPLECHPSPAGLFEHGKKLKELWRWHSRQQPAARHRRPREQSGFWRSHFTLGRRHGFGDIACAVRTPA